MSGDIGYTFIYMKNHSVTQVQSPRFAAVPNKQFKLTRCATQPFMHAIERGIKALSAQRSA
jgi:hypothetical protein